MVALRSVVARRAGPQRHHDQDRDADAGRAYRRSRSQVLLQTSQSEFPVVDEAQKPVGLLGRADIIRALKELEPDARVSRGHDHEPSHRGSPAPAG